MRGSSDFDGRLIWSKDFTADATWDGVMRRLNTSTSDIDANGVGVSANTSTIVLLAPGGFPDQRVTATMRYVAPTTAGGEDFGVLFRFVNYEEDDDYYWARVDGQQAKITKSLAGEWSTLSSSAFALAQDTDVTITAQIVGTAITCSFDAGGSPTTVNMATSDSDISKPGFIGLRSYNSSFRCSAVTVEQL